MNNEGRLTIKNGILIQCDRNVFGNIVIPEGVTYIGDWAFDGCSGLTSVTIPDSVTSIGDCAFYGCRGLTSVTIPNSVTSIGEYAFYKCSGLTSVAIPNTVTSIGNYAFDSCRGLTSVTIPNTVTSIGDGVFRGCSGLTSVTIPDSVTSIGDCAFFNCCSLSNIIIPNSVTSIGRYVFFGCEKLLNKSAEQGVFYKAFNTNMTCRGYQYNFGTNRFDGEPIMCMRGFHYCDNPLSVFDYYSGVDGEDIIICKVKPMGTIIKGKSHKHVCNAIEVLERVTFNDIFELYIRSK